MKKLLLVIAVACMLLESGCATLFGESGLSKDQLMAQHHKPVNGEPKRQIRPAAVICDIVFGVVIIAPVWLGIDFLTGDIYKPGKYVYVPTTYKCIVQKDTLKADTLSGMSYNDKILNIAFTITNTDIDFTLDNKTQYSMKINWDDVTIIQDGTTHRAVHTGVKLTNRNESQPASTIPSNASINDGVVPSDNIEWHSAVNEYDQSEWKYSPLNIISSIRLYLPIQYQGKTIEYNITFVSQHSHS